MTVENMIIEEDDSVEVELASPWERIGAYMLNNVFNFIAMIPAIAGLIMGAAKANDQGLTEEALIAAMFGNAWFWLGLLVYFAFGAWQIYLMSKYGQSLGKKLLNLRVIRTNGDDAGFVNVVLLREVVYQVGLSVVAGIFGVMGDVGSILGSLAQLGVGIACLVMLFAHSERRTIQDLIADTVVIKLPR